MGGFLSIIPLRPVFTKIINYCGWGRGPIVPPCPHPHIMDVEMLRAILFLACAGIAGASIGIVCGAIIRSLLEPAPPRPFRHNMLMGCGRHARIDRVRQGAR